MVIYKINAYVKAAKVIEKQFNCKIYIVGGYVRDRILGHNSIDLDFVVDGNGVAAAEILHKKFGGKLTVYKKFLTASLKLKTCFVIDIATARKEKYPTPASMPVVTPSNLEDDLKRRDFTINSMAVRSTSFPPLKLWRTGILSATNALADRRPSSLVPRPSDIIDPCGGLDDLKNKLVRVLHKKSFIDDPTRILRAIRYASRFNFNIEKNTAKWLTSAIEKNLLSLVSPPRIRDEFIKALEEKKAKKILKEFKKRKILKYIDKNLNISAISASRESVQTRLKKLLKNFKNEQKTSFLKKLQLPSKYS